MSEVRPNENVEILLGLPGKIEAGVQTSINYAVICTYAGSPELLSNENDLIIIQDENGKDVSSYFWWARPGKYTITVASFAICPALGPEKAPREITYLTNPPPVSGLKSYDYDKLRAALDSNPPTRLIAEDKTFDFRSSPHNAKVQNLNFENPDSLPSNVTLQTIT